RPSSDLAPARLAQTKPLNQLHQLRPAKWLVDVAVRSTGPRPLEVRTPGPGGEHVQRNPAGAGAGLTIRQTVRPSIPGRTTSSRTRSNDPSRTRRSPSAPVDAVSTST